MPQTEIPSNFGEDGLMPMTFAFEDDAWAIMVTNDQGRPRPEISARSPTTTRGGS